MNDFYKEGIDNVDKAIFKVMEASHSDGELENNVATWVYTLRYLDSYWMAAFDTINENLNEHGKDKFLQHGLSDSWANVLVADPIFMGTAVQGAICRLFKRTYSDYDFSRVELASHLDAEYIEYVWDVYSDISVRHITMDRRLDKDVT